MKQSRRMSFVETMANVLVGYAIAVSTQVLILPMFGARLSVAENMQIGVLFTVISIVRSYTLRRVFEAIRVHSR